MKRRTFLGLASAGVLGGLAWRYWPDEGFWNPCLGGTPEELLEHDVVQRAWQGLDPAQVWDLHVHLLGNGDSGSGIFLNPKMLEWTSPAHSVRYKFYINASCADEDKDRGIDLGFIDRLLRLQKEFPEGYKSMLLAFSHYHNEDGIVESDKTAFYIPNEYVSQVQQSYPKQLEWVASVHPYREDAIEQLELAVKNGARCLKWLPSVMGIDPSSAKCDAFYDALVKHNLPLLTHAGHEYAVADVQHQGYGNPLLLRRPLELGVRVIVGHCANEGKGFDLDTTSKLKEVSNFDLFVRLMEEKQFESNLFGEISAMTQVNHVGPPLTTTIQRDDWHHRLINGSDYPLPGVMPVFSVELMVESKYITQTEATVLREIRRYNPLMYDFLLKRCLRVGDSKLSDNVFMTRRHFI